MSPLRARQFERAQEWQDNYEAAVDWGDAAFATQTREPIFLFARAFPAQP